MLICEEGGGSGSPEGRSAKRADARKLPCWGQFIFDVPQRSIVAETHEGGHHASAKSSFPAHPAADRGRHAGGGASDRRRRHTRAAPPPPGAAPARGTPAPRRR